MRIRFSLALIFISVSCSKHPAGDHVSGNSTSSPDGMVWIAGGDFTMGTDERDSYPHERPAHRVRVSGFWLDVNEVTNKDFKTFVDATGYVTVAERKLDWEELKKTLPHGTPRPPDSVLVPGSLVFVQPDLSVTTNNPAQWWVWRPGASWRQPEGPGSNLEGRWNHPVVHIAYEDAVAYCNWKGRRLPTEAEWEFASRGGDDGQRFAWGSDLRPGGKLMANTYQGSFPLRNLAEDGFEGTAPVKSFAPNPYGVYDMIGNVWEWTSDYYHAHYYSELAKGALTIDPQGPVECFDPNEPYAVKRVTKGGSFLCADNYCVNYRPSARQGTSVDSGSSNIGFRTALSPH